MTGSGGGTTHKACPEPIIFTEAIKDSPRFRASLNKHTQYFNKLEARLQEMLRQISQIMEYSRCYVNAFYKLTGTMNQMCEESFSGNVLATSAFSALHDAYSATVTLSRELAMLTESRNRFDIMSANMDEILMKNASIPKSKPGEAIEGKNTLTAMGSCFAHTTLDYVAQLNIVHTQKDYVIIDALWSFVKDSSSFFSRGHAVFDEWTASDNGAVADSVAALAEKKKLTQRRMHDVHDLVPKNRWELKMIKRKEKTNHLGMVDDSRSTRLLTPAEKPMEAHSMTKWHISNTPSQPCSSTYKDEIKTPAIRIHRRDTNVGPPPARHLAPLPLPRRPLQTSPERCQLPTTSAAGRSQLSLTPKAVAFQPAYRQSTILLPSNSKLRADNTSHTTWYTEPDFSSCHVQNKNACALVEGYDQVTRVHNIPIVSDVQTVPTRSASLDTFAFIAYKPGRSSIEKFFNDDEGYELPFSKKSLKASRSTVSCEDVGAKGKKGGRHSLKTFVAGRRGRWGGGKAKKREIPEISDPVLIEWNDAVEEMFQHSSGMSPDADVMMEGYLMKRSSNAFKTWNRRWFQIKDSKLLYCHRSGESEEPTVMEDNLMLCLVRPAPPNVDRAACFELVTPTRSHLLQADSESLCNDWMRALQRTILALHESDDGSPKPSSSKTDTKSTTTGLNTKQSPSKSDSVTAFEQIRRVPGNEFCADCGSEQPKWVSINLGVVLCIECSGVHRSLGVQVSKVRSLTMDSIDSELRDVLLGLGNRQVNAVYLAHMPETDVIPPPASDTSNRQQREAWIIAKYVERRFAVPIDERTKSAALQRQEHLGQRKVSPTFDTGVCRSTSYADVKDAELSLRFSHNELSVPERYPLTKRLSSCGSDPNMRATQVEEHSDWETISEAARTGDIIVILRSIAVGVDVNSVQNGTTLLHIATRNGQTATVEFLLLNGAKINLLDDKLNTALHLAAQEGNTLQICQLLKRGADKGLSNVDGLTPLDIAVEGKYADIVTLFRVHTMRDEFNEEFDNPMDDTLDSVVSDITRRAAQKSSSG